MGEPVVKFVLGFQNGTDDVDDTEVRTVWNLDVGGVLVLWQNKATLTFD